MIRITVFSFVFHCQLIYYSPGMVPCHTSVFSYLHSIPVNSTSTKMLQNKLLFWFYVFSHKLYGKLFSIIYKSWGIQIYKCIPMDPYLLLYFSIRGSLSAPNGSYYSLFYCLLFHSLLLFLDFLVGYTHTKGTYTIILFSLRQSRRRWLNVLTCTR